MVPATNDGDEPVICVELGRDSWGSGGFGSSYGGARGGGPMRGDYGSRDSGPYGGLFTYSFHVIMQIKLIL